MDRSPLQPDNSGLFVIRLLRSGEGLELRGCLEHVLSGRRHPFDDGLGLLASLRHERSQADRPRPAPPAAPGAGAAAAAPPEGPPQSGLHPP